MLLGWEEVRLRAKHAEASAVSSRLSRYVDRGMPGGLEGPGLSRMLSGEWSMPLTFNPQIYIRQPSTNKSGD